MYVIFQFLPMILIPAGCVLFRSRFTRQSDLYAVLGFYVLAKVAEHFDAAIFGLTGSISGHSLKHLFAAMGAYWVARMLLREQRQDRLLLESLANFSSHIGKLLAFSR